MAHEHVENCKSCEKLQERATVIISQLEEFLLVAVKNLDMPDDEKTDALRQILKNLVLTTLYNISNPQNKLLSFSITASNFIGDLNYGVSEVLDNEFGSTIRNNTDKEVH